MIGTILGLALAAGVQAAPPEPPPPEVAVVLLPGPHEEDNARMLASLERTGAAPGSITAVPPALASGSFDGCLSDVDPEPCVRAVLRQSPQGQAPTVAVLVEGGPGFHVRWRCVGAGDGPADADRQTVAMDTLPWRAGPRERWEADRTRAADCVLAAAAEDRPTMEERRRR